MMKRAHNSGGISKRPSLSLHDISYFLAYTLLKPGALKARVLRRINSNRHALSPSSANLLSTVRQVAEHIYGAHWNMYSDALLPEVISVFAHSIEILHDDFASVNYLEIGSAQGLSMSVMGLHLRQRALLGRLVSIDPYFDNGYVEEHVHVKIDQVSRTNALALYDALHLKVDLLDKISDLALLELIERRCEFELIYIDGFHSGLQPTLDFALSYHLLRDGGVIIIDDHAWPGVTSLKSLCDCHCEKINECWKAAAYRIRKEVGGLPSISP